MNYDGQSRLPLPSTIAFICIVSSAASLMLFVSMKDPTLDTRKDASAVCRFRLIFFFLDIGISREE